MTVALQYFSQVLSPWVPGVENPLPPLVNKLASPDPAAGFAVDVGSGPGVFLCYLAQSFGRVVAIDRDPQMVEAASELVEKLRDRGAELGDVEIRCADWADCDDLRGADVVCTVNSMLEPDTERRARMFANLAGSLAPGGALLAVFPAMEAQIHLLRLFAAALTEQDGLSPAELRQWVDAEFLTAHHFDALAGTFASRDEPAQKFYYQLELAWELADVGFELAELSPLVYPWEVCRQVDAGYFPGATELWDWFVSAKLTAAP